METLALLSPIATQALLLSTITTAWSADSPTTAVTTLRSYVATEVALASPIDLEDTP